MSEECPLAPGLFPDGQCRLILIGKTGHGKSSTGNSILGGRVFRPQVGINSGTKEGSLQSAMRGEIEIQVVDTPGLHDTEVKNDVISLRITRSLLSVHPGPHAILLCLSCSQRFTAEEVEVYEALKELFGPSMVNFLILIFTRRDELESKGANFENQLERCTELKKIVKEAGHRYVLFDNRDSLSREEKEEQVSRLLAHVQTVVELNGRSHFTHKHTGMLNESMKRMMSVTSCDIRAENEYNSREQDAEEVNQPELREHAGGRGPDFEPLSSTLAHEGRGGKDREGREETEEGKREKAKERGAGQGEFIDAFPRISHLNSIIVLKERKKVTEQKKLWETRTQLEGKPKELSEKLKLKPRETSAGNERTLLGAARRRGKAGPQDKELLRPQTAPERTNPSNRPERKHLGLSPSVQELSEESQEQLEKPPRALVESPTGRVNELTAYFQQVGVGEETGKRTTRRSPELLPNPVSRGMRFSKKQQMVEEVLKKKLAEGTELAPEQEKELEKTSKSLGRKILEAMGKFKVEKLDKCTVM